MYAATQKLSHNDQLKIIASEEKQEKTKKKLTLTLPVQ